MPVRKLMEKKKSNGTKGVLTLRRIEKKPTVVDLFSEGDKLKQEKKYSTEEEIALSHPLRERR
jgi:hypothetical protein